MKKQNIFTIFIFWMLLAFIQCKDKQSREIYDFSQIDSLVTSGKISYNQVIDSIDKIKGELVYLEELYDIKDFLFLFENSEKFQKNALEYIGDSSKSLQQKIIAICSVQDLPADKYIDFASKSVKLYKERKINGQLIELVIITNFTLNYTVVKNYKNEEVIALLNSVKDDPQTSTRFKDFIKEILTGEMWRNIR